MNRSRRAMTLVELLAASALAAVLLTALVGVLRSLSTQRRTLLAGTTTEPWRTQLSRQIRWDLVNARRMGVRPGELRLVGYGGCDFTTGEPTFRPSEVVYYIHDDGERHWLLRKEIHLDDAALHNHRTELVCAGVAGLTARNVDESIDGDRPDGDTARRQTDLPAALSAIPDRLRLVLFDEKESINVLDEVVVLGASGNRSRP